jgi:K+-transporting ATPase ATPase C chain
MFSDLTRQLRPAMVMFVALTLLTGVVYPLVVNGLAAAIFPAAARGSLIIREDGKTIGSALIGQPFDNPRYFWGRPSATSPRQYNAGASTGSNLGPTNPTLQALVKSRVAALKNANLAGQESPPVDLVTASASGLDPHISPAAAYYQVERVAAARGLSKEQVTRLVEQHVEPRTLGLLGEPRVNVLQLNMELDNL